MSYKEITSYMDDEIKIARFAKAMGHPARIAILKLLSAQTKCFCGDIVQELPLSQSTVSQHLKELKDAGLIDGEITPPKVCYCLNNQNWVLANKLFNNFFK